jgi:hypothetical protein
VKKLHIAIASTTSKPGAVADNLRQIAKFAEQAGRDGADLLLTPEMSASGYGPYPEILKTAEVAGRGKIYEKLAKSAEKNDVAICADSGIEKLDDYLFENKVRLLLVPTGAGGKREERVSSDELRTEAGRKRYSEWLEKVFFPGRQSIEDCIKYRRALAAVNLCGYDGKKHYHIGHGMIITRMGEAPALFHGLPNLDRQRPMYAHAVVDFG